MKPVLALGLSLIAALCGLWSGAIKQSQGSTASGFETNAGVIHFVSNGISLFTSDSIYYSTVIYIMMGIRTSMTMASPLTLYQSDRW